MTGKIVITGPGAYCRADGVKVSVRGHDGTGLMPYYGSDGYHREAHGGGNGVDDKYRIISTWANRPDEFRRPKPAYRKDGKTCRWPVGTRAVLVEWEDGARANPGWAITVREDGFPYWDGHEYQVQACPKGERPLFRKLPEPEAPGGKGQALVLYGKPGGEWGTLWAWRDTHRLTLHIDTAGNVTGKMEAV